MKHTRPSGDPLQWGYVGVAGNLAQVQDARGQVAAMDLTAIVAHIECTESERTEVLAALEEVLIGHREDIADRLMGLASDLAERTIAQVQRNRHQEVVKRAEAMVRASAASAPREATA